MQERRLTHPSTGGTHTNKPLWLLEKYRSIPPSPSFLFLGDFWLLTLSRAEVFGKFKLFAPGCNCKKKKEKKKLNPLVVDVPGGHGYPYKMESKTEDN